MAAATSDTRPRSERGERADEAELRAFFHEYESHIGIRSSYGAMLAALAGVRMAAGSPSSWDPYERAIDGGRVAQGKRVYRTLRLMADTGRGDDVVVLFRLYGPRNASAEHPALGALAPLAAYTAAAEEARATLATRASARREERVGEAVERDQAEAREALCRDFWHAAACMAALARRIDEETARQEGPISVRTPAGAARADRIRARAKERVDALRARLAGWRETQRRILDAYAYDGRLRARLGAITATDREVSAEDAIRAKLEAQGRRPGTDAHGAWMAARSAFIARVTTEASRLRARAHASYRAAKAWS